MNIDLEKILRRQLTFKDAEIVLGVLNEHRVEQVIENYLEEEIEELLESSSEQDLQDEVDDLEGELFEANKTIKELEEKVKHKESLESQIKHLEREKSLSFNK